METKDPTEQRVALLEAVVPGRVFRGTVDSAGELTLHYLSEGAEALFGIPRAELLSPGGILRSASAEQQPSPAVSLMAAVRDLTPWRTRIVVAAPGGTRRLHLAAQVERGPDGEVTVTGVVSEPAAGADSQAWQDESEERFRRLFEASFEGILIHDNGRVLEVNAAFKQLTGYTESELRSINVMDLATPESRTVVWDHVRRGDEAPYEATAVRKDGTTIHVELRGKSVLYRGRPARVTAIRDITDRKRREQRLTDAYEETRRHLAFSEQLLGSIPAAIFFKDRDGRYLGCNRAFTELLGVRSDEIRGKTAHDLWPAELADVYHRKDLELMQNPVPQYYEFQVVDRTGMSRDVFFGKDVFRDAAGNVAGLIGAFIDITDRKRAEAALQSALTEKDELLRELQHRIKNSLHLITSLVGLEAGRSTSEETHAVLEDLEHRVVSISNLYTMLYQSGSHTDVPLADYCRTIIDSLRASLTGDNLHIAYSSDADGVRLDARRASLLGLVLTELVTNALKHAFPDGRSGTIAAELSSTRGMVELTVSDDGVGLPGPGSCESAAGIGLQLVRTLAQQLDGTLSCANRTGAHFSLAIPFDDA